MRISRNKVSLTLYIVSITLIFSVWLFVVLVSKSFIFSGEGIGVYGVLIYYAAALCSALLWWASYLFSKNRRLSIIYWLIFFALTVFVALQPTWWAAPGISS